MITSKNGPIAVFFTHGVSLELWEQRGMFSRELKFYQALAEKVGELWFFTYGRNDAQYIDRLGEPIRLFPKCLPIPNILYGLLVPLLHWRQLKKVRFIRIHQMAGAIPALLTHWMFKKPLIVRCGFEWLIFLKHQNAPRVKQWIVGLIEKTAFQAAHMIIVTTKSDAGCIAQNDRIDEKKIMIIPNYVDTDLFKPMKIEKQKKTICFVGRLEKQKNLFALIESVKGLDVRLILYGEGSLKTALEHQARTLNVNAEFRGRIENERLPEALNACELFILPSLYEGNPKVLLEAMACGMPVIGTRVEGISSLIEHEQNGILCETDADSIRKTIQQLLLDSENQARLGKAARQTILETSSLSRAINTEATLYQYL